MADLGTHSPQPVAIPMWPSGWLARCSPARLWVQTDIGGLARYQNDSYQQVERQDTSRVPGNLWFVCTMWLARYRLRLAQTQEEPGRGIQAARVGRPARPAVGHNGCRSCTHTPASHSRSRP